MGNWGSAHQFNKLYDKLHLVPDGEMGIRLLKQMLIKSGQERATGVSVQMGEFQRMTLVMSRQRFRMEGPASAENSV